jgi:hypothetical protein
VGFFPFGPAALTLRMAFSLFWLRPEQRINVLARAALALLLWGMLCVLQPLLGYAAKLVACAYVVRHNAAQGGKPGPRVIHVKDLGGGGGGGTGGPGPGAAGKPGGATPAPAAMPGTGGMPFVLSSSPHANAPGRAKAE